MDCHSMRMTGHDSRESQRATLMKRRSGRLAWASTPLSLTAKNHLYLPAAKRWHFSGNPILSSQDDYIYLPTNPVLTQISFSTIGILHQQSHHSCLWHSFWPVV